MNTLIKVSISHSSPGTLILNSWRAQLDMMWILNLWICIETFLLVYWDLGLFAFVKDCEHICILEDDLSL